MKNSPTLYTLTGLPYAGKTTLRNELVKRFGFFVISVDQIMDAKDMWREGHPTPEDWSVAYTEAHKQLEELLSSGKSVIFDGGSLKFSERQRQKQITTDLGAQHKLIYVNTPKEEIIKRRMKNLTIQERGHLDDNQINTAFSMFEEPKPNESPIIYTPDMDIDEWITKNIKE